MFLLTGTARYLFVPLGEAVVFAVLASYVLSRTLVPTLVRWLYRGAAHGVRAVEPAPVRAWLRPFVRIHAAFENGFERLRAFHAASLGAVLRHRRAALVGIRSALCRDSPPPSPARPGLLPGGRQRPAPTSSPGAQRDTIEETARLTDEVERAIRAEIPAAEVAGILDNIGIPSGGIPLTYIDSGLVGTADADVLVSLRTGHAPTDRYARRLRARLSSGFPGTTFYFLPADIVSQTYNFGLPAPFDIQIVGRDQAKSRAVASTACASRSARSRAPWTCASSSHPISRASRSRWTAPRPRRWG